MMQLRIRNNMIRHCIGFGRKYRPFLCEFLWNWNVSWCNVMKYLNFLVGHLTLNQPLTNRDLKTFLMPFEQTRNFGRMNVVEGSLNECTFNCRFCQFNWILNKIHKRNPWMDDEWTCELARIEMVLITWIWKFV